MKKAIAVITGSFNPIQNAHVNLGNQVLKKYPNVERVIYVPVSNKYAKDELQDSEYRYKILKSVCDAREKFEVSRIEIDNSTQLYTYQTLDLLKKEFEEYDIYLVIGSDNLKSFHTWKRYKYLLEKYKVIVFSRNDDNLEDIVSKSEYLSKYSDRISFVVANDFLNVSSTQVRNNIKQGKEFKHLLPKEAYEYIMKNNKYEKENRYE